MGIREAFSRSCAAVQETSCRRKRAGQRNAKHNITASFPVDDAEAIRQKYCAEREDRHERAVNKALHCMHKYASGLFVKRVLSNGVANESQECKAGSAIHC